MKGKDNLTQIGFKYYRKMINNLKHYFYPDTFSAEKCLYWTTFTCIEVQRKIIRQCSEQFDEREQLFTYMGRRWVEYRRQIIENISGEKQRSCCHVEGQMPEINGVSEQYLSKSTDGN